MLRRLCRGRKQLMIPDDSCFVISGPSQDAASGGGSGGGGFRAADVPRKFHGDLVIIRVTNHPGLRESINILRLGIGSGRRQAQERRSHRQKQPNTQEQEGAQNGARLRRTKTGRNGAPRDTMVHPRVHREVQIYEALIMP